VKEKIEPAAAAARKPAATEPGGATPADALEGSPKLAAQRQQLEQGFGKPKCPPALRRKGKPTHEELLKVLAGCVSNAKGSGWAKSAEVYAALAGYVDGGGDLGVVLLKWCENAGTDRPGVGSHMAATASWADGTYVVDTTASQFGGSAVCIDTIDNWKATILGLQRARVSNATCELLARPHEPTA
jgi:hypothetical protein